MFSNFAMPTIPGWVAIAIVVVMATVTGGVGSRWWRVFALVMIGAGAYGAWQIGVRVPFLTFNDCRLLGLAAFVGAGVTGFLGDGAPAA